MNGQCLCGAVRFTFTVRKPEIGACHCHQCQRWTGGSPLFCVRVKDVIIEGEENISRYRASDHGERGFCKVCGTTLFWKMQGEPIASLTVGLLDDAAGYAVTEEIFVDRRAGWQPAWAGASQSSEAEEFEKLERHLAMVGEANDG